MINAERIKLIVWDLDDTFWRGTLSEENVHPLSVNITLVKRLAERGIVSTICSKNDFAAAKEKLKELGVWEYFVFSSIDWTPKGERVKKIISDMSLRPVNVLFIDDNPTNLKEVAYFSPGIMTALPEECLGKLNRCVDTIGKDDINLSRLKQYRILEKKHDVQNKSSSNEEFLRSCHINIKINKNCGDQLSRIVELVQRSNQLNYTKIRSTENELKAIFADAKVECAYVTACDDFGDYGIIGFYALNKNNNELIHFLFSCRTMGMGIEQFLYATLNFPLLNTVGEVATALNSVDKPDWINVVTKSTTEVTVTKSVENRGKVLFKGPCDTDSSLAFIQSSARFDCEFTFVNDQGLTISAHNTTFHALQSLTITEEQREFYRKHNPFWDDQLYTTQMFKGDYDIVFFSLFKEAVSGLYEDRHTGVKFVHDDWYVDATNPQQWKRYTQNPLLKINEDQMRDFSEIFTYCGRIAQSDILNNILEIRKKLPDKCLLVLSIPTSYQYVDKINPEKNDRYVFNAQLIRLLETSLKPYSNIRIIDYTKFANREDDFMDSSNHFSKKVYYRIAEEYEKMIKEWCGISVKNKANHYIYLYSAMDYIRNILKRNKKLVSMFRKFKGAKRK